MSNETSERSYTWIMTHEEYIPREIARMVDALGLEETVEKYAGSVHERAIASDFEILDADALASGAVFAATRLQGLGVSIDEVIEVSRGDGQTIRSTYRSLNRRLRLSIQPRGVEPYVKRFAPKLSLPEEASQRARRLSRDAAEAGLDSGMAPDTLAACLIYIISLHDELGFTQQDIREATGVGTKTIRNHYREVAQTLDVPLHPQGGMDEIERRDEPRTMADATDRLLELYDMGSGFWRYHMDLLNAYEDMGGKSPAGLIGGAFWVAYCDFSHEGPDDIEQGDLAHHLGISEATIQQRASEFREGDYDV